MRATGAGVFLSGAGRGSGIGTWAAASVADNRRPARSVIGSIRIGSEFAMDKGGKAEADGKHCGARPLYTAICAARPWR